MVKGQKIMHKYGLIGKDISYSFSKGYFEKKFDSLGLVDHSYDNFDLRNLNDLPSLLDNNIKGLNVTIPYKEKVMDFLDSIDKEAEDIGAVNTIKIYNNELKGFNTDVYGFEESIKPLLKKHHKKGLILGSGGASKAVRHVFCKLDIDSIIVSRNPKKNQISYLDLERDIMLNHAVIINCTPLGTYPRVTKYPDIPYEFITKKHLLFDLIYNPAETAFLKKGKKMGASIKNGHEMLELQAEKSWEIWHL